jgi:hypothetical protein
LLLAYDLVFGNKEKKLMVSSKPLDSASSSDF